MKVLNQVCRILAVVFGLAAVVLFFFPLVKIPVGSDSATLSGAMLAFGTKVTVAKKTYAMAKSSYFLLSFLLAAFATVMAGISLFVKKAEGTKIAGFVGAFIGTILTLVIACCNAKRFVDSRPIYSSAEAIKSSVKFGYESIIWIIFGLFLLATVVGVAGWLINDYLECLAAKDRLTIWQKVKKFFRDIIGEVKKIIWPGPQSIFKDSVIVLVICAIIGAFIWIVDKVLGLLLQLLQNINF